MSFEGIISACIDFFNTHTIFAIAIAIAIAVFAFWRPKAVVKLAVFILILGAVVWVLGIIGGSFTTGVKHKDDLTHKTDRIFKNDQGLDPAPIDGRFADRVKEKIGQVNKTD